MTPIEEQVESIVDSILEDYCNGRAVDKMDHFCHPDKAVVIDMIGKLLRIVYPGSARDKTFRIYNMRHNLSMLIEDVMYNLNKQLTLLYKAELGDQAAAEKAQELSVEFFRAGSGDSACMQARRVCKESDRGEKLGAACYAHHGLHGGSGREIRYRS